MTKIVAQPTEIAHRRDEVVSWALTLLVMGNIIMALGVGIVFSISSIGDLYNREMFGSLGLIIYIFLIAAVIWLLSMLTTLVLSIVGLRRVYRQDNRHDMVRAWVVLLFPSLLILSLLGIICYAFLANHLW